VPKLVEKTFSNQKLGKRRLFEIENDNGFNVLNFAI
jgi:hypothetical protein